MALRSSFRDSLDIDSMRAAQATWLDAADVVIGFDEDEHCDDAVALQLIDDFLLSDVAASSPALIDKLTADLSVISTAIRTTEQSLRATRQQREQRRLSRATPRLRTPAARSTKAATLTKSPLEKSTKCKRTRERKKDDDALDCIYAELQESVGMCRYWGKKCWNLRVPKPKGGFHSLCHFHRAKANDNQRRFDYKRRGTLWRSFKPDPNSTDTSLFPAVPGDSSSDCGGALGAEGQSRPETAAKFEPFACPVALQDQDVELLRELMR